MRYASDYYVDDDGSVHYNDGCLARFMLQLCPLSAFSVGVIRVGVCRWPRVLRTPFNTWGRSLRPTHWCLRNQEKRIEAP